MFQLIVYHEHTISDKGLTFYFRCAGDIISQAYRRQPV